ncbi:MAG: LamG domain-containing protein [Candidatus Aenigmatarchaeota archaeon]
MKAVSPLIGFVLTIFMTVMVTTLTFTVIRPALERNRGFNVINEASVNLELLSSAINEVASEAEGSRRTVTLSVSDGEYLIDKNSNSIIFTFEPSVDLGVIGRIADKFLEKGLAFFDFFNNYLDNSLPNNLINVSGNWRVYNNRLEGINGTAYYFIDKNLNGFYVSSNFGSDNNLGQIFVSPVNLSNLVLYLTFDEGSGSIVYDYSGNKNNGTLYNGSNVCSNPPTSGCPTWVDGKFGKALSFDGIDDYVIIGDVFGFEGNATFSVVFWVFDRGFDGKWARLVSKEKIATPRQGWLVVRAASENKYKLERWRDGVGDAVSIYYTPNQWNFIAFTYNGSHMRGYLNGALISISPSTLSLIPTGTPLTIGKISDGAEFFNGTIDELLIYNKALSEEEIKLLYQEGLKKLQNSGMLQFNSKIKPYIAISNPSGKIYVENLRVGNQNSREIKLIKPFYNLEFNSSFRFSKGNHQIKIENIGFNSTSKRPIIRISES